MHITAFTKNLKHISKFVLPAPLKGAFFCDVKKQTINDIINT